MNYRDEYDQGRCGNEEGDEPFLKVIEEFHEQASCERARHRPGRRAIRRSGDQLALKPVSL
jgi:hypothetical protein